MSCGCERLADVEEVDGFALTLENSMSPVASDATEWVEQKSCPVCGSQWVVDISDGRTKRFMTRARASWSAAEAARRREAIKAKERVDLVESAGGATNERCVWAGCENPRVRDFAMCVNHLIP